MKSFLLEGNNKLFIPIGVLFVILVWLFFKMKEVEPDEKYPLVKELEAYQKVRLEQLKSAEKSSNNAPKSTSKSISSATDSQGNKTYTYTVRADETLFKISRRFNVNMTDIKIKNKLNAESLRSGQKLQISITELHKVQSGETLSAIARQYNIKAELIKTANELTSEDIKEGELLIIPMP
jgi:N-acetylmuramoyl-L-alanine amidase